jgi:protoporphyrinogen oxidase/GT2 family glycosyltransferase
MSKQNIKSIAILGAGIAGLSAAYYLKKNGFNVQVFERESYYGGLARSFDWHGFSCDFAAHRFFTNDEDVLRSVFRLNPMLRHVRRSKLFVRNAWLNDPINPIELMRLLPKKDALLLVKDLTKPSKTIDQAKSFEEYILARYGRIMHQTFFRPSTEKLFRIPANQISVLWALRKARLVNPFKKMDGKSRKYFAYFYYPLEGGYGSISDAYYRKVKESVLLNSEVTGILRKDNCVVGIEYQQGEETKSFDCDLIISTLPLTLTGKMLGINVPLSYQKVDAVYLLINKPEVGPYHWAYYIDADISINRKVEFKHMSRVNTPRDTSVICAEVTSSEADPAGKVIKDLQRAGYVESKDVVDTLVVREEYAYPVYKVGYEEIVQSTIEQIKQTQNVYVLGRAAEFIHREIDDIIGASKKLVKQIMEDCLGTEVDLITEDVEPENTAIVVLSYNNAADTMECLGSLSKLAGGPYHIYLVDNGSTDSTVDKVREQFPDVEVLALGHNFGVPIGFNKGIIKALRDGFEYVMILNNDTVSDPKMITEMLQVAQADHDCAIVMPKVCYYPPKERPLTRSDVWADGGYFRKFPPTIKLKDNRTRIDFDNPRKIEYAPTCGLLMHKRVFDNIGLFDEGFFFFYEDWDYSERIRAAGLNIWVAPKALLWHKVSKATGKDMSFYWQQMGESTARFMNRHYSKSGKFFQEGYLILRDFFLKPSNFKYLKNYIKGLTLGNSKALDSYPDLSVIEHNDSKFDD